MSLSIGIVGLPNVGKSTLFNALTNAGALAANYPFATIDPNVGVVPIPDSRLQALGAIFGSARLVPATVTFVDIAGLVEGASQGEGLGNRFLANIRDVSAICHVVRAFQTQNVVHVADKLDPQRDIEIIEAELALADLDTVERRLPRLAKEATVDKGLVPKVALLEEVRDTLGSGMMVSAHPTLSLRSSEFADLHLLTAKPVIYVFNMDEAGLADVSRKAEMESLVAPSRSLFLDAQIEAELSELDPVARTELLEISGQSEPGLDAVIRAAYDTLGLQSFLTAGPKETRAWTIARGATAPEAAGTIHTDFERGFIAAEVVGFGELVAAGSWNGARAAGLLRTEGRSYRMRPDDVVEFRFNV